jgi:HPt (histidine-containing phosphotransfer) domain-containing protein
MTIKECYEAMGGDYEDVLKRLMNEARIQKFALMFKKDPSMSQLTQAMETGDVETAFRAAHTLKGICANLGFKSLFEVSYDITEALRAGDMEQAKGYVARCAGMLCTRGECIKSAGTVKS